MKPNGAGVSGCRSQRTRPTARGRLEACPTFNCIVSAKKNTRIERSGPRTYWFLQVKRFLAIVGLNGRGQGIFTVEVPGGALASIVKDDVITPARVLGAVSASGAQPVAGFAENFDGVTVPAKK